MGSENSKGESRERYGPRQQPRQNQMQQPRQNQMQQSYVAEARAPTPLHHQSKVLGSTSSQSQDTPRQQPRQNQLQQSYVAEARAPTSLHLQSKVPSLTSSQSQDSSERLRSPYSYTNRDLHAIHNAVPPSTLYPNLNANRISTPQPTVQTSVTVESRQSNGYSGSSSGLGGRNEAEEFVFVNNFGQQRLCPKPSAPSPVEATVPEQKPKVNPTRAPAPLALWNNASSSASTSTNATANNKPNPASRGRATDDRFNCPSCSKKLGLAIYQCSTGHGSCEVCREANRPCGKCNSPLTNTRNIMLEGFIAEQQLLHKTACQNAGCTLSFNDPDMEKHRKECPFGEMSCLMGKFFGQCSSICKVDDMASHFDAFHKEQRTADVGKEMCITNICTESHKIFLVKNGPYNFVVHNKVSEADRTIYMAVQLIGTGTSASKWTYEVHVYNKRQPRRKFEYTDNCISISTPVDDLFKEYKCASVPLSHAMTFVNESALTYKFFLKKVGNAKRRNNGRWKHQNE